ncbi:MAG TPA: selenium cofactor biosynthesis protein YqeC [Feifaniaceae bacterium]|nr:selenium cofactor biosynthesis protein YqeC [Feifaniaceae bacterium]
MQTILLGKNDSLANAFCVPNGIASMVGGGGKTTLMLALASELAEAGHSVIVSTTTHIFPPDGMVTLTDATEQTVKAALAECRLICLGTPSEQGKLSAPKLTVSAIERLADYVLLEADGAKRLPLKAPADQEPVIPPETKLVIAVLGLDGIGKPIQESAFRPERYAALNGKTIQDTVTPADAARVLTHPNGQRKGITDAMRFCVLLNKADDAAQNALALEIARELNGTGLAERTVIAALGS